MLTPELFTIEMRKFLDDLDTSMDTQTLMSYYERLSEEMDDDIFLKALDRLRDKWTGYGRAYPTKLEIIRASKLDDDELDEVASLAYKTAKETAINYGVYISPDFEDPIIADVIQERFGSWFNFHNQVAYIDSNDTWVEKKFIETYKRKLKTNKVQKVKLVGYLKPEYLSVSCSYSIPLKIQDTPQIANNTLKMINNLANSKKI